MSLSPRQLVSTGDRFGNNFDFLRFAAASCIILSHAYALTTGYAAMHWNDPLLLVGQLGLATLFVISGYLISMSWDHSRSALQFIWKRSLRVFPGLICGILFVLLVIGPLATDLSTGEYLSRLFSPAAMATLPFFEGGASLGLFAANPVPFFTDAPLWTIPVEFAMYLVVVVLGVVGLLRGGRWLLLLIAADTMLWMLWSADPALAKIRFTLYFLIGAYFYQQRESIEYRLEIALSLCIVLLVAAATPFVFFASLICVPYLVLYAAHIPTARISRFGARGDFSYGMYIYSYPIQQTLVLATANTLTIPALTVISFALTLPVAVLSWNLVESRFLALKGRGPGRRLAGDRHPGECNT